MSYRIVYFIGVIQNILLLPAIGAYSNKPSKSRVDGSVRLVGGEIYNEGNVEILQLGRWGAICDRSWTVKEASVVCRQLGFSNDHKVIPTKSARFGKAKSKICDTFKVSRIFCLLRPFAGNLSMLALSLYKKKLSKKE